LKRRGAFKAFLQLCLTRFNAFLVVAQPEDVKYNVGILVILKSNQDS
jgi:hypothetical protein